MSSRAHLRNRRHVPTDGDNMSTKLEGSVCEASSFSIVFLCVNALRCENLEIVQQRLKKRVVVDGSSVILLRS